MSDIWVSPNRATQLKAVDPGYSYYKHNPMFARKYKKKVYGLKKRQHFEQLRKEESLINPMDYIPTEVQSAILASDNWDKCFQPKTIPEENDWLNTETGIGDRNGQTFQQWMDACKPSPISYNSKIGLIFVDSDINIDIHLNVRNNGNNNNNYDWKTSDLITVSLMSILEEFVSIFFDMSVKILPNMNIGSIETRVNSNTHLPQLNCSDILDLLEPKRHQMSKEFFVLMGVSIMDLYPNESWNFVFGQASMRFSVGIFSFARYLPGFYEIISSSTFASNVKTKIFGKHHELKKLLQRKTSEKKRKKRKSKVRKNVVILPLKENEQSLFLRRCLQVLCHELGHLFFFQHCVFFECVMNGANHLVESDGQPCYLCPVCLHKLYFSRWKLYQSNARTKNVNKSVDGDSDMKENMNLNEKQSKIKLQPFNIIERYENIATFMIKYGFNEDAEWYKKRIESIELSKAKCEND